MNRNNLVRNDKMDLAEKGDKNRETKNAINLDTSGTRESADSSRDRRLPRPGDSARSKLAQILGIGKIIPDPNFAMVIPIPSEDARVLGLKIPEEHPSKRIPNSSGRPPSCSSKSSASSNQPKGEKSQEVKGAFSPVSGSALQRSKLQSFKEGRPIESPKGFQAKLERGLRNISNRTGSLTRKTKIEGKKNLFPWLLTSAGGAPRPTSCKEEKPVESQEVPEVLDQDTADRSTEPDSKSMRHLFSMADSWSSDSVVSHSDNCSCCHGTEKCPLHGKINLESEND
ncbi:uncharacterized protein LOC105703318 [Orussus abietinus]|uniref:uncharacterized protein LOC105703318 n=1 Tax=Orussus abietinus TaxID=222816 RepID=UPI000625D62C|nr:uncharacterized protein LOC105703318 [Orussus abietinus]